jgi:hypothetical protein
VASPASQGVLEDTKLITGPPVDGYLTSKEKNLPADHTSRNKWVIAWTYGFHAQVFRMQTDYFKDTPRLLNCIGCFTLCCGQRWALTGDISQTMTPLLVPYRTTIYSKTTDHCYFMVTYSGAFYPKPGFVWSLRPLLVFTMSSAATPWNPDGTWLIISTTRMHTGWAGMKWLGTDVLLTGASLKQPHKRLTATQKIIVRFRAPHGPNSRKCSRTSLISHPL